MQAPSNELLRRAQLDSASLHLARGLSPYDKIKEDPRENASTFPRVFSYFIARLNANANITR